MYSPDSLREKHAKHMYMHMLHVVHVLASLGVFLS